MPNREKVISGLEEIANDKWMKIHADWYVSVCNDALELLKEQDAKVEPKRMYHDKRASFDNYLCECKSELYYTQRYCDVCGRSVKWY